MDPGSNDHSEKRNIPNLVDNRIDGQTLAYRLEANHKIPVPEFAGILRYKDTVDLAFHTDTEGELPISLVLFQLVHQISSIVFPLV